MEDRSPPPSRNLRRRLAAACVAALLSSPAASFSAPAAPRRRGGAARAATVQRDGDGEGGGAIRPARTSPIPTLAVIGRPNVGKSALVNRIAGTQSGGSIVADVSGITRDRTYRPGNFLGHDFRLVDTGGLVFDDDAGTLFASEIRQQAMVALEESVAAVLVVDGLAGCSPMDLALAEFLRKEVNVPVHVAVNKCESEKTGMLNAADFWQLGLGEPMPVSAIHGVGTAELLEKIFESVPELAADAFRDDSADAELLEEFPYLSGVIEKNRKAAANAPGVNLREQIAQETEEINVAIVGRPNVGKSSLLNKLFGDQRAIVSEMAGTTRDSIDALMERPSPDGIVPPVLYRFVDTAGIRRKNKVDFGPEFFMVNRALRAIRRSDVALLVLDATAGVAEQDRILAQKVSDDGRACIIVCNKWDAVVNKDDTTYEKSVRYFRMELPMVRWAPILFVSAVTGQRCKKVYDLVDAAVAAHRKRISTAVLNEILRDAIMWQPPPSRRSGAQAKIYYCNQVSVRPPTIVVFVNDPKLVSDNYKRYLDRKFRESLDGFESTPIRWLFRGRRVRDVMRAGRGNTMNGDPGDGGSGKSYPYPHAG